MSIHELTVDVECQVILQQGGVQSQTRRCTLEVRSLQDTVLVGVTYAESVRHIADTTLNGYVMVAGYSGMEDLILPVGVLVAQESGGLRVGTVVRLDECAILIAIQHVKGFLLH